jgi:hypothetical protein
LHLDPSALRWAALFLPFRQKRKSTANQDIGVQPRVAGGCLAADGYVG